MNVVAQASLSIKSRAKETPGTLRGSDPMTLQMRVHNQCQKWLKLQSTAVVSLKCMRKSTLNTHACIVVSATTGQAQVCQRRSLIRKRSVGNGPPHRIMEPLQDTAAIVSFRSHHQ